MAVAEVSFEYPIEDKLKDAEKYITELQEALRGREQDIRQWCLEKARVEVSAGAEEQTVGGWISRADALAQYIIHGKEKPKKTVLPPSWGSDPSRELVGYDESTHEHIYADDDYHTDADGIMILTKNLPSIKD